MRIPEWEEAVEALEAWWIAEHRYYDARERMNGVDPEPEAEMAQAYRDLVERRSALQRLIEGSAEQAAKENSSPPTDHPPPAPTPAMEP